MRDMRLAEGRQRLTSTFLSKMLNPNILFLVTLVGGLVAAIICLS